MQYKNFSVLRTSLPDLYCLDGRKLPEEFLEGYAERDCNRLSCNKCGYCLKIANKAVLLIEESKFKVVLQDGKDIRGQIAGVTLLY